MKEWIRDYFTFNRKEQRGIAILLGIMLLSVLFGTYGHHLRKEKSYDMSGFMAQVEAMMNDTAELDHDKIQKTGAKQSLSGEPAGTGTARFLADPFYFDPNKLSEAQWQQVGLDEKIIRNILKYRENGGAFRKKEDLARIYGMTPDIFNSLAPYISIDAEEKTYGKKAYERTNQIPVKADEKTATTEPALKIELNLADSAELTLLPGIGPSYASRIIRYRNLLGGFYRTDQLLEVRGMDSARFDGIADRLTTDSTLVLKMDLNVVTFKEMLRHPYFEYHLVKSIFNYRDHRERFDSVGQIRHLDVMYPELYDKLSPYLEVKPSEQE